MILYHCNFGFPLVDKGTEIVCRGKWKSRGLPLDDNIFNSNNNYKICPLPLKSHSGTGEAGAFVTPISDSRGICLAGLYNKKLKLAVSIKFSQKQLPCLSNWQHWGKNEYVTGLEPGTNFPIGQKTAKEQKKLIYLAPGETRKYNIVIEVLKDEKEIKNFLKTGR
jgi:hypothetical protein